MIDVIVIFAIDQTAWAAPPTHPVLYLALTLNVGGGVYSAIAYFARATAMLICAALFRVGLSPHGIVRSLIFAMLSIVGCVARQYFIAMFYVLFCMVGGELFSAICIVSCTFRTMLGTIVCFVC